MILNLYHTNDESNVVNKVLESKHELNINVGNDFDIINPVLLLSNELEFNVKDFNYCEIPDINRKYFISEIVAVNMEVFRLNCVCDVLETFKDSFLNSECRYLTPIKQGDYGEVSLDSTGRLLTTNYTSNVELVPSTKAILSVMGGFYG